MVLGLFQKLQQECRLFFLFFLVVKAEMVCSPWLSLWMEHLPHTSKKEGDPDCK